MEDNLLISHMNGSFNDAFIFIYNYFEMPSDNVCAKLCGLDHKTIASYYNKTAKEPHYKNVIAICCGFNLRPRVSKKLLSTIRIDLDISTAPEDHLYNIFALIKNKLTTFNGGGVKYNCFILNGKSSMEVSKIISLRCKICGEQMRIESTNCGMDVYVCDTCGSRIVVENDIQIEDIKKIEEEHNKIVELRQSGNFSEVLIRCQEIIDRNKDVSFAYIERLYVKYGIQFPKSDEYKATFYNIPLSIKKGNAYRFEDEEDYKKAYLLANESEKSLYSKIAQDINISVNIYNEIYNNTENYDVFISYKRTEGVDKDGNEILTQDAREVEELRNELIAKRGLKVFLAPYSIKKGYRYEPQIYAALIKAKVMVLYGSKSEYFSSQWVKNEWKRFFDRVHTDRYKNKEIGYKLDGSLIVVTKNVNATLLPKELSLIQCIDTKQIYSDANVLDVIASRVKAYLLNKTIDKKEIRLKRIRKKLLKDKTKKIIKNSFKIVLICSILLFTFCLVFFPSTIIGYSKLKCYDDVVSTSFKE